VAPKEGVALAAAQEEEGTVEARVAVA